MANNLQIEGHKLNYHPERVAAWLEKGDAYPIYLEVGISSVCNHRCIFCALDYRGYKGKLIDAKILVNSFKEMAECGVKSVMFSGEGEPAMHPDFLSILQNAKNAGLDIALTTNGVNFTKQKAELSLPILSWVKFSIDAGTRENYAKIHGTKPEDFDKLLVNINDAVKIKKKNNYSVKIGTQLLLINENMDEVIVLAKKLKEIGADYFVVKPYSQHPDSINKINVDYEKSKKLKDPLNKLNSDNFKIIFREETMDLLKEDIPYNICYGLSFFAIIDEEGNLIPCHLFHGKEEYYYGNLYKNSFSEIWSSKKRKDVLEKIQSSGTAGCRRNCRLDPINRYLHNLKNPPEHKNFI